MKDVSSKTQSMLDNRYQVDPKAMVIVDIAPPFAGADFNQAGCEPSLCLHNGQLYMVFIDTGVIKIVLIDQEKLKAVSLLRQIEAPNVSRPKLVFESSTYPGRSDLPHVAYNDIATGKVMVYREQYTEDLDIQPIIDEIGAGTCVEVIRSGNDFYHFFVATDGKVYLRKQGEYTITPIINPEPFKKIAEIRALTMPDRRLAILYTSVNGLGASDLRIAYSNYILPVEMTDDSGLELTAMLSSCEWSTAVYVSGVNNEYTNTHIDDSGIELTGTLSELSIFFKGQISNESCELLSELKSFIMVAPYIFDTDRLEMTSMAISLVFPAMYSFYESCEVTSSLQAFELFS